MASLVATVEGVEIMRVNLKKASTSLGRKRQNDIVLDNMAVSGEHCVFEIEGRGEVYVKDVGSTNGTYLNGRVVRARELLTDQDSLAIGNFRLVFSSAEQPRPRASQDDTRTLWLDSGMPGIGGVVAASLKVRNGNSAGLEVPIVKMVTTFGQPGSSVISIAHRRNGYYVASMNTTAPVLLNSRELGEEPRLLAHGDVLDLSGMQMEFLLAAQG
jgi:FHA domain